MPDQYTVRQPSVVVSCQQCNTAFTATASSLRYGRKFCSLRCSTAAKLAKRTVYTCKRCGASFRLAPSKAKYGYGTYCSRACHNGERINLTCQRCGALFALPPSQAAARGGRKYCSRGCQFPDRIARTCQMCGAGFSVTPNRARRGIDKFCSQKCSGANVATILSRPLEERFWEKVDKDGPLAERFPDFGQCWEWTAHRREGGYGTIGTAPGMSNLASRVAWIMRGGPIIATDFVCHACDNPACVRNDDLGFYEVQGVFLIRRGHLFLGTPAANMADMRAKGRHPQFRK